MLIDNVEVQAGADFSESELKYYVDVAKSKFPDDTITKLEVRLEEDGRVALTYTKQGVKFERVRRITGYLVGTLDRWNDAKRSEESERVKHL